jgi:hypothetical protein
MATSLTALVPELKPSEREALLQLAGEHVLEFGCGGSTVMLLAHGHRVTSIESDPEWVRKVLGAAFFERDRLDLRRVDIGPVGRFGAPVSVKLSQRWADYWSAGDDTEPDAVFVDGRFRMACAINAALHWKVPILLHDFNLSRRPAYAELPQFLNLVDVVGHLAIFDPTGPAPAASGRLYALARYAADWR